MGKEGGVDDDPQKIEKRNKSSKKREKNEESSMGIDESQSISAVKEIENMQGLEIEDIVEMKKQRRRDKKKKKKKGTKDIEGVDIEKKGVKESKSVYGEDVNDDATDNAAQKSKKREKKSRIEGDKSKKLLEEESVYGVESGKEAKKERKKQKMVTINHKDGDIEKEGDKEDGKVLGAHSENSEVNVMGMVERKKRKREKKRSKNESEKMSETLNEANIKDLVEKTQRKKKKKKRSNVQSNDYDGNKTGKREREKKKEKYSDNDSHIMENADKGKKKKKIKLVDNDLVTPTPNKSNKKVRFSGEDEVFTLHGDSSENYGEDGLLRGMRFTPEEDEIVKQAVLKYIAENDLGEEGLNMVMNSIKHRKLRGCWNEIASAIPYRPYKSIYCRAQILFRRSKERKWTQEEYDLLIKYQEEHGNHWRPLADKLGKHIKHVQNAWRRVKLKDMKKGTLVPERVSEIFRSFVHSDLKLKVSQEKKMKHGMLRDNIGWEVISDELSTRTDVSCCQKWYYQLTSRMVIEGVWVDSDDYRLIGALYNLDATCMEDVDWDDLIDGRSGELCRKRWSQMVLHIGHHGLKSFGEQVDVMAQRYCPHLLEAREIWDSKPRVP